MRTGNDGLWFRAVPDDANSGGARGWGGLPAALLRTKRNTALSSTWTSDAQKRGEVFLARAYRL